MATSENTPVEPQEPRYVRIEKYGKAYHDGWGWLIIPILKFIGLLLITALAIIMREYYGIEIAAISGAIAGAKQLVSKYLDNQKKPIDSE